MGAACSTTGDLTTERSVAGCPICDNRPSEQATWAGQCELSQDRLHHLARWNEQAPFFSTFEGLVDYLTGQTNSDVEKFWVLFHWIQLESRRQQTHKSQTVDSPWGFLRAVQNGKRPHAELYKKLCRTAGLRCKIVTGLCKSIADKSNGSAADQGTSKSSWNEVTINGRRALVDCRLELDFEPIRIPPFHFLAHPTHFATTHFPYNKSHQLLEVDVTSEQFGGHVTCFPAFFDLDRDAVEHTGVVRTDDGVATLKLGTTKPLQFCLNKTEAEGEVDLSKYVKQLSGSANSPMTVVVRPPSVGLFKLQIWLQNEKSDKSFPVCLYTIRCEKTAVDCLPFKGDTETDRKTYKRKERMHISGSSQDRHYESTSANRPASITWSDEPMAPGPRTRSAREMLQSEGRSKQISGGSLSENVPSVPTDTDYPKTYKAWTRECVLYRPKARTLTKGAFIKFKLRVPHANRLSILLPLPENGYKKVVLKSRDEGATWRGNARVPDWTEVERRCVLVVDTPRGTTQEECLLEYNIGDRKPPEGESTEDHGSDLKLQDLQDSRLRPIPTGCGYHIMISYSWAQQKKILRIKKHLDKVGYRVWLDKDEIEGTMLESMAKGVKSSAIIIIACSEEYAGSENCKREANFARDQKKTIIPLKMTSYEPHNWLGMLISGIFYVDFSSSRPFKDSLQELERKIEDKLKKLGH